MTHSTILAFASTATKLSKERAWSFCSGLRLGLACQATSKYSRFGSWLGENRGKHALTPIMVPRSPLNRAGRLCPSIVTACPWITNAVLFEISGFKVRTGFLVRYRVLTVYPPHSSLTEVPNCEAAEGSSRPFPFPIHRNIQQNRTFNGSRPCRFDRPPKPTWTLAYISAVFTDIRARERPSSFCSASVDRQNDIDLARALPAFASVPGGRPQAGFATPPAGP